MLAAGHISVMERLRRFLQNIDVSYLRVDEAGCNRQ